MRATVPRLWAACFVMVGCGGGSSDNAVAPGANGRPIPIIESPAQGSTYQAGDALLFSASATDAEDGSLPASAITWWVEFHHGDHTHPFLPTTPGRSGTLAIPVRGETADDVFYRIHLRATDSAGQTAEITRDLLPRKARVTLATQPAGLTLTLDGQPVTGPSSVTGVTGIERDLGATDQTANGRRYRFDSWSDGQPASHTIATPGSDTTYTAAFTDLGPATHQPPTVSLSAPSTGTVGVPLSLAAIAGDADGHVTQVDFFAGSTLLHSDTTSPYTCAWRVPKPGGASYALQAKAYDSNNNVGTSATVLVTAR